MNKVKLNNFSNDWYKPGNKITIILWYIAQFLFFKTEVPYPSKLKAVILRLFGAKIGKNVNIKPNVSIKYPWFLEIGNNVWLGENSWLDNLGTISIGDNVCISQGAYLFNGNHNYKKENFALLLKEIILEEGAWIGAKSVVCPGVICKSHSILAAGSVATTNLEPYKIYQGNPAIYKRTRKIEDPSSELTS
jgi:putative colanic acid biosynthesis acetyltransferase WcaF